MPARQNSTATFSVLYPDNTQRFYTSSSSTSVNVSAQYIKEGVQGEIDELAELYYDCIGSRCPRLVREQLAQLLSEVGRKNIEYALTESAFAPRPSWRYALAILSRLAKRQMRPTHVIEKKAPVNPACDYEQRDYSDKAHQENMPDWLAKAWEAMQLEEAQRNSNEI